MNRRTWMALALAVGTAGPVLAQTPTKPVAVVNGVAISAAEL